MRTFFTLRKLRLRLAAVSSLASEARIGACKLLQLISLRLRGAASRRCPLEASAGQAFHHGILSTSERYGSRLASRLKTRGICCVIQYITNICLLLRRYNYLYQWQHISHESHKKIRSAKMKYAHTQSIYEFLSEYMRSRMEAAFASGCSTK